MKIKKERFKIEQKNKILLLGKILRNDYINLQHIINWLVKWILKQNIFWISKNTI